MAHTEREAVQSANGFAKELDRFRSLIFALAFALALGLTTGITGVEQANAQEGDSVSYAASSLATQSTKDIKDLNIYISSSMATYTGFEVKPTVEIIDYDFDAYESGSKTLVEGTDYTLDFKNNVNAGIATITITGKGNFSGKKDETFEIGQAYMLDVSASTLPSFTYSGNAYTPKPTLTLGAYTLKEGVDYLLNYEYNTNAGKAYVTAEAIGNFSGSKLLEFTIFPAQISAATLSIADQYYDGYAKTPGLSTATFNGKALDSYTDYTIAYTNNTNPGIASAVVTGSGNFTGTKSLTFQIVKNSIAGAVVSNVSSSEYTGRAIKQYEIVRIGEVTLNSGTDYTVSYKNNKNVGTAKMTITGKGGYTGTKTVQFKITKAKNSLYAFASSSMIKKASVKKKAATLKAIYLNGAKGKVTYTKKSGSAKLAVNKSTGKVTVKKGTGKGTYSMKVAVKAAGNKNYKAATKTVTVKVKVY